MKKQIYILAAFMICGIALAACSDKDNDDNTNIVNNPDPTNVETESTPSLPQSYTLTIKATKGSDESLSKALSLDDKTLTASWKQGEKVTVYNGDTKIGELTAQSDGASTTLSGDKLSPAPSASDKLTLKFNETDYSGQDGTLETIASTYDYATATVTVKSVSDDGNITIEESAADFQNQQAIVKFTLKSGETDIMATSLKVNDYTITPASATNVYYVAIPDADAKNINLVATDGTDTYTLYKTNVNFDNGKYYAINITKLKLILNLSSITGDTEVKDGTILTGELGGDHKISIADGATVTLSGITINGTNDEAYQWAGITCNGNATIILEGENTVKGFCERYPGIYIATDHTLTIDGTGSLNVSSNGRAAGIGGGDSWYDCGNITINGGTINAEGGKESAGIGSGHSRCGNITINGGTINAVGGDEGAGIGTGNHTARCEDITINGGNITATGGEYASGIGCGDATTHCGNITISGGTIIAKGGKDAVGIGNGDGYYNSTCGDITITNGVTQVTAIKGESCENSIGTGTYGGTCGTITIEDGANVIQQ